MNILEALRTRHSDAVFVEECKMGEAGSRRLDAWVLLKTWSPPTILGYEIKTDRSDFLRDRKWESYRPVCHELYFACPAKLIAPEELPSDVGLLWTAGSRLVTKRKAARRQPDAAALVTLMSYVLMSRTRIVANMWRANEEETNLEYWRRWLVEKREAKEIGHLISDRLRIALDAARREQRNAESERDRLLSVRNELAKLGLDPEADARTVRWWADGGAVRSGLRRLKMEAASILTIVEQVESELEKDAVKT